ncbi:hydroxymethylbilane synthase [Bosea sp. PAMC 26642]|uniref:hydroxymethylbilane synthase n=1 Tax=Bosea sp. (strain PAMC 26642) TaxID=1792307 RepID=UPI0007705517|nr:hydroxymethylbilane synthase [Bosea sp. PAMC 26642]AMJ61835.1 porphobilinogen deaminase [Bosea sp. PAMC 26642]
MTQTADSPPLRPAGSFVIGTRGSPLALAQAHEFAGRMSEAHGWASDELAVDVIRTTGDSIQDRPLSEAGGKGLFTKEIDAAQLEGRIDFAIHSAKDLPTALPAGLVIAGYMPREDVRDALIARDATSIAGLRRGAIVGSASLRRQAILRRARPDIEIVLLRGNVGTRLDKVARGEIDATLLAFAGLKRLGLADRISALLPLDECLPAVGQGAIAIVIREGDEGSSEALAPILCRDTGIALAAERAFLTELDGSCRTPIAGHATVSGERFHLRGLLLSPDGTAIAEDACSGPVADAAALGAELGRSLRVRAPRGIYT